MIEINGKSQLSVSSVSSPHHLRITSVPIDMDQLRSWYGLDTEIVCFKLSNDSFKLKKRKITKKRGSTERFSETIIKKYVFIEGALFLFFCTFAMFSKHFKLNLRSN